MKHGMQLPNEAFGERDKDGDRKRQMRGQGRMLEIYWGDGEGVCIGNLREMITVKGRKIQKQNQVCNIFKNNI